MANEYIKDTISAGTIDFQAGNKVLKDQTKNLPWFSVYTVLEMKTNVTEIDLNHKSPYDEPCFFADLRLENTY